MKLTKYSIFASFACLGAMFVASCDEVDLSERLTEVEKAKVKRTVLIEDFTGQKCVNCPKASEAIGALHETYGDAVVAVGLHSGPFSHKTPNMKSPRLSLGTEFGDNYYTSAGITMQPAVLVNRNGSVVYDHNKIAEAVKNALEEEAVVDMKSLTATAETDGSYSIEAKVIAVEGEIETNIQFWALESGIIDTQSMPDGSENEAYEHNHVFRASLDASAEGQSFTLNDTEEITANASFTPKDNWSVGNMDIVAIVSDKTTGKVLFAGSVSLK